VNVLRDTDTSRILSPNTVVSDVVYRPLETNFLKYFKNSQRKIYGVSMLINQAAPCFKKWFGVTPIIDEKLLEIIKKEISI
jgi:shikimate dehydrogenase